MAPPTPRRVDPGLVEATASLIAAGWSLRQIARALHYSRYHVAAAREVLRAAGRLDWEPERIPWHNPRTREGALDRGRELVVAKLARGEWVLPKGEVA